MHCSTQCLYICCASNNSWFNLFDWWRRNRRQQLEQCVVSDDIFWADSAIASIEPKQTTFDLLLFVYCRRRRPLNSISKRLQPMTLSMSESEQASSQPTASRLSGSSHFISLECIGWHTSSYHHQTMGTWAEGNSVLSVQCQQHIQPRRNKLLLPLLLKWMMMSSTAGILGLHPCHVSKYRAQIT